MSYFGNFFGESQASAGGGPLSPPALSPAGSKLNPRTFFNIVNVSMSVQAGAGIIYTTDGTVPVAGNENTQVYTGPLRVTKTTVLTAVAVSGGVASDPVQGWYERRTA